MKIKEKIIGSAEMWETGVLGKAATHAVQAPPALNQQVDDALGLQMISIRLPKELIEEFKVIAQYHNLGYQPLMRDALKRFAESEFKRITTLTVNEKIAREQAKAKRELPHGAECDGDAAPIKGSHKKVA
jgi:hypothetical protein